MLQPELESLASQSTTVRESLENISKGSIVQRIWNMDHRVWKPNPDSIVNRLGWLTVIGLMAHSTESLEEFALQIRSEGFQSIVLMAMGGSAMAPKVFNTTLPRAKGYPPLFVLDSTVPEMIQVVVDAIDLGKTLFIVASKSGETIEVTSLYKYFRYRVDQQIGTESAGNHFIAITDPGTPLETLAQNGNFRKVFLNPETVGGRFSGLSLFGLVPAALMGADIKGFVESVDSMRNRCKPEKSSVENPGVLLGTTMGSLALKGIDKLTLITSPSLEDFGLWVEQMIAESLGKENSGIIPIANEPRLQPETYAKDRLFIHLNLEGDEVSEIEEFLQSMENLNHPIIRLNLTGLEDLGSELFRWAFATAIAGHLLGVNPFDQPSVQAAKDFTEKELAEYKLNGVLLSTQSDSTMENLLIHASPGDYLALLSYLPESAAIDTILCEIRTVIQNHYKIATTAGYGPRYLHSTGQLHKGGPDTGLFVQFVTNPSLDLDIPGAGYTFGLLAEAQARGDIRALQEQGRRVIRVQLGVDPVSDLITIRDSLSPLENPSSSHI